MFFALLSCAVLAVILFVLVSISKRTTNRCEDREQTNRAENMLTLRQVSDENDRLRRYIDEMESTTGAKNGN